MQTQGGDKTTDRGSGQGITQIVGTALDALAGNQHRQGHEQSATTRVEPNQYGGHADRGCGVSGRKALPPTTGADQGEEASKGVPDVSLEGELTRSDADDHQFDNIRRQSGSQGRRHDPWHCPASKGVENPEYDHDCYHTQPIAKRLDQFQALPDETGAVTGGAPAGKGEIDRQCDSGTNQQNGRQEEVSPAPSE